VQTFSIHCWSDETDEINHAPIREHTRFRLGLWGNHIG